MRLSRRALAALVAVVTVTSVASVLLTLALSGTPSRVAAAPRRPAPVVTGPDYPVQCGTQLCLAGRPFAVVGTNAFGLATDQAHNFGCGPQADDLDGLLHDLPADAVVRVWAFQGLARNPGTLAYDFTGLDRLFAAAVRAHVFLLPVLGNQDGTCDDGHWKDDGWYAGGYRQAFDDDGAHRDPASFWDYLSAVIPRYASSPALFGWELMNEPQASRCTAPATGAGCYAALSCPVGGDTALRGFFDTVGARARQLDGHGHLMLMGVAGTDQCGVNAGQYAEVLASPGIDVGTFHDYGDPLDLLPTTLGERLTMARQLGKPLLDEEVGITGGSGCLPDRERGQLLGARAHAARLAGAIGLLPWNLQPVEQGCGYDFGPQAMTADQLVADTAADPSKAGPRPWPVAAGH